MRNPLGCCTFAAMNLPSKWMEEAVDQMASLPGIGKKTALRLVLAMMNKSDDETQRFADAFVNLKANVKSCKNCHNLSDSDICSVCSNPKRDAGVICVVEDIRDVMAIEATGEYVGHFHVLGGIISPMDGIAPADLNIETLIQRAHDEDCREVIFALSTTMEGETTSFFLSRKLKEANVQLSTIARGVSIGDELQYADEVTLARSIHHRMPYENSMNRK